MFKVFKMSVWTGSLRKWKNLEDTVNQSDYTSAKVRSTTIRKIKQKLDWNVLKKLSNLQNALKKFVLAIRSCSKYAEGVFNIALCVAFYT